MIGLGLALGQGAVLSQERHQLTTGVWLGEAISWYFGKEEAAAPEEFLFHSIKAFAFSSSGVQKISIIPICSLCAVCSREGRWS